MFFLVVINFLFIPNVDARRGCCSWHGGVSGTCRDGMIVCNDGTKSPSCTCEGGSTNTTAPSTRNYVNYVYGCTDSNSINYNSKANKDDGTCIKKVLGCTDQNAYNYNASANTDDGTCIEKILGCINEKAINYNEDANTADGSCQFKKIKTTYKKIKYKTKYKYSFFSKKGKVLQKGENGKRKITTKIITNENNEIIEEKVISKKIVKKSYPKIIATKKKTKN